MRRALAALLLAGYVTGAPEWAVCANAQAASLFQEVEVAPGPKRSHTLSWLTGLAGVGLLAASFPLAAHADDLYGRYESETDLGRIEDRYRESQRADRIASGTLIAGEALLVTAVWLRFVRRPADARTALILEPARCAVSYRF